MPPLTSALSAALDQQLAALDERLTAAATYLRRGHTDDFLVATAQQIGAFNQVVVPALAKVPEGRALGDQFLSACRHLERAMVVAKAKQYGQAQNVTRPWPEVWDAVREHMTAVAAAERAAVQRLTETLTDEELEAIRFQFAAAMQTSPTRPHPSLPHRGVAGRATRAVVRRADRVWDQFEGRVSHPLRDVS